MLTTLRGINLVTPQISHFILIGTCDYTKCSNIYVPNCNLLSDFAVIYHLPYNSVALISCLLGSISAAVGAARNVAYFAQSQKS